MTASQKALAAFFSLAGILHFAMPKPYEAIVPAYVPIAPRDAVIYSGCAELLGGLAVLPNATRGIARWWLIGLLVAIFPANVHMAMSPEEVPGLKERPIPGWALWARLPLQFLMMAWVWQATARR